MFANMPEHVKPSAATILHIGIAWRCHMILGIAIIPRVMVDPRVGLAGCNDVSTEKTDQRSWAVCWYM